jgi:malonyl-ACP O-methyltransferase BioC
MRIGKIQQNFNQAARFYEDLALPQKTAALKLTQTLIKHLPLFKPQAILDLGCGTGFITEALQVHFSNAHFILNDLAENMLSLCQNKFKSKNYSFLPGDMEKIQLPQVDLIASNFSLQWSNNIYSYVSKLFQTTQILCFSCLVEGSLQSWQEEFPHQVLMHYPKIQELMQHIKNLDANAYIWTEKLPLSADNPKDFMRQLKHIGAATPFEKSSIQQLRQVINKNTPIQTEYHVLFAILENDR